MPNLRKFHYALVSVSDGKCRPQPSRIKLCSEYLVLQREEFHIWEDENSYPVEPGLRYVSLLFDEYSFPVKHGPTFVSSC